jgi:hypothetical protein
VHGENAPNGRYRQHTGQRRSPQHRPAHRGLHERGMLKDLIDSL